VTGTAEMIADYIEDQARWRGQKAADYPGDARNEASAEGLKKLAEYVRALPDDDQRLATLFVLEATDTGGESRDIFSPGPQVSRTISRFCFNYHSENYGMFLYDLIPGAIEDRRELCRDADIGDNEDWLTARAGSEAYGLSAHALAALRERLLFGDAQQHLVEPPSTN
jgi:hypothetical protein